jgi:hypothetical protein
MARSGLRALRYALCALLSALLIPRHAARATPFSKGGRALIAVAEDYRLFLLCIQTVYPKPKIHYLKFKLRINRLYYLAVSNFTIEELIFK